MSEERPIEPVAENRTVTKLSQENRRLRGYIAVFKEYADRHAEIELLVRALMKSSGAPTRDLLALHADIARALERLDLALRALEEKRP